MLKKLLRNLPFSGIYRKLRDKRYYRKLRKTSVVSPYGFVFYGDPEFATERESYDVQVLNHFFKLNDVFVDVGANIGYYSLLASQKGLKVISFEPLEDNAELIRKSIKSNNFDIELHQIALSDYEGTTKIYGGREGGSLLKGWGDIRQNYYNFCKVEKLDNILSDKYCSKNIFLKIDAEGVEYNILKGSINLLSKNDNVTLYIENGFKENFSHGINPNFKNVFEFLFGLGYKCFVDIDFKDEIDIHIINSWMSNDTRDRYVINYIFKK